MRRVEGGRCVFVPGANNRKECANANCGAGLPPVPVTDPCSKCRAECIFDFLNPIPGITIEKGAQSAGDKAGKVAGQIAKAVANKVNKVSGAYNLGVCMDKCKKICNKGQCNEP